MNNILVIGGGGREHAITRQLINSDHVNKVYVSPGNAGTACELKCENIDLNLKQFDDVAKWCKEKKIDLVFIGPEDPLANGLVNKLSLEGILCFGPTCEAAEIEASKSFAKDFMTRHNIPTARFSSFSDASSAVSYIKSAPFPALVVKASGLAAGKGVIVASTVEEACAAAKDILEGKQFGDAGSTIVVEEKLEGDEVSCLAFTDGEHIVCMPPAQDHKRLLEGDQGPNTGGMGAYCPCPLVTQEQLEFIQREVLQRTVDGLRAEKRLFRGILYAGIMLTKEGPRVLEFNCRFGDPETQVLLPHLKSDLYMVARACAQGELSRTKVEFVPPGQLTTLCVVGVAKGYPGSYAKGAEVTGLEVLAGKGSNTWVIHAGTKLGDNQQVLTNGGRVLAVVATGNDVRTALDCALEGMACLNFDGLQYRRDIGYKALTTSGTSSLTYKSAGVDIAAGDSLVRQIKPMAQATTRSGCSSELGLFGAVFDPRAAGYTNPLLVSGTDGVGTKLKIAQSSGDHSSIGQDLVAMCVNDVLCHGAEPLFFLDYFACGRLDPHLAAQVVKGVADGCLMAGCALVGGETAEMPGMYSGNDYDIAGFVVGAVEANQMLPRVAEIEAGDLLLGVASSGIHSNGFSLVRKIVANANLNYEDPAPFDVSQSLGTALMTPTRIYSKTLLAVVHLPHVKAAAHITGGGILDNLPRVLPSGLGADMDAERWTIPSVFHWLALQGGLSDTELLRTFNMGLGMVLVVSADGADSVLASVQAAAGQTASIVGEVVLHHTVGQSRVHVRNMPTWKGDHVTKTDERVPVGVLISGSGTNMQALLDHCADPSRGSKCRIAVVISNVPGVQGLERARAAGVPTKVIPHKDFSSRENFECAVDAELTARGVRFVCLAGFMRILSPYLVSKWRGRMINVHPSLLPSFRGAHAHRLALKAGVRVTGATVHYVIEDVDAGGIIAQGSTRVLPKDTESTLQERVKLEVEHSIFPQAMEDVARGRCHLQEDNTVQWTD